MRLEIQCKFFLLKSKIKKMVYLLFLSTLIFSSYTLTAQRQKYTLEMLEGLSEDSLSKLAEKFITDKSFNREYFDLVTIKKIDKADQKNYYITFKPSLMYLPRRHLFYSTVTVDLLSGLAGNTIELKWRRYKNKAPYYQHTHKAKRVFCFISKAIEKKWESPPLTSKSKSNATSVHKRFLYYFVETNSSSTYGSYKVQKITGRIYGERHKHKMKESLE